LYRDVLGRDYDTGGLEFWSNQLRGGVTGANIANEFYNSSEFITRSVSNDTYVDILFQTLMNRNADTMEKTFWLNQLDAGVPRTSVFAGLVNSPEFDSVCRQAGIIFEWYT